MPCRLRDLSIATTVLSLTVTVTIAVSLLGTSMYETVDAMASVSEHLAFGLARDIVDERGKYLALEMETRLFRPMREVVWMGAVAAQAVGGGDFLDWPQSVYCVHGMLEHLGGGTHLFPREGWIVVRRNSTSLLAIKAFYDDDGVRVLKVSNSSGEVKYYDRYPEPLEQDVFEREPAEAKAHGDSFIREDQTIDYKWTEVTLDPDGEMEMGYGGPILQGKPLSDNYFVFTETPLTLLRPLLMSLVRGGETVFENEYDNPAYVPILNETIVCILETGSGLLLACSHGFSALRVNGSWHRVKGEDSEHPVVGPALREAAQSQGGVFSTTGTTRFPLTHATRYFVQKEPLLNGPPWSRVVITPYDQLLKEVEEKTDEERDGAMATIMTTVLLAVGTTLVAIVVGGVISARISRPLSELVKDMQRMEVMDTAGVTTSKDGPVSMVREVEEMKASFLAMVSMLVEYKSFIPKHLVDVEETSTEEEETRSGTKSGSISTTRSKTHAVEVNHVKNMFTLELAGRQCSVCTLMVSPGKKQKSELATEYNALLAGLMTTCAGMNPYITLTFDSVVVGFNAAARLMSFKEKGLRCMMGFVKGASPLAVGCSYELSQASVGNVGTSGTRFYAVCPDENVRSRVVPAYAAKKGWGNVYCGEQVVLACQSFVFLTVDVVESPSGMWKVSRCLSEKKEDTEEWMYSLDEANNLPHAVFNSAFKDMLAGKLEAAAAGFKSCEQHFPEEAGRFVVMLFAEEAKTVDADWYTKQMSYHTCNCMKH